MISSVLCQLMREHWQRGKKCKEIVHINHRIDKPGVVVEYRTLECDLLSCRGSE